MRRIPKPHKITKVIPQVTRLAAWKRFRQQRKALSLFSCMDASRWKLFYFAATSECVMACTDKAMRFCTPTLRINFATCAFTVRSSIPN